MMKKFLVIMLAMGMSLSLAACGSSAGSEDKGNDTTAEASTEAETTEATTEVEKEVVELSADEYYVDCPISLDPDDVEHTGKQVYVKIPPLMNFYPDREKYDGITYYEDYLNTDYFFTIIESEDDSATVSYEMDEGDHFFINWCKEFEGDMWSYEVGEPETWDNGITAYKVTSIYDDTGSNTVQYVLYYPLEDGSEMMVCTSGFLGSPHLAPQGFQESHDTIMEFYRTAEDLFVVVDPETMEVVVE